MTGCGQSRITREGTTLTIDIQCLNSRFFDLNIKLPRMMQKWEHQVRQEVQQSLIRGKANVTVTVAFEGNTDVSIRLNRTLLRQYQEIFNQIQEELSLADSPSLIHYTSLNDIIEVEKAERDDLLKELLIQALTEALAEVKSMRETEGTNLAADITHRLDLVQEEQQTVERLATEHRAGDLERYRGRIQELITSASVDEGRLLQEAAILADKHDITEECTRFNSHLQLFKLYIDDEHDSGKRLGFLLQEMGREVNTIGSKTDHVEISHAVVRIKSELEKIREQVQNIL